MNAGKTLFSQIIDFPSRITFVRCVTRYGDDRSVKSLTCAKQYWGMVLVQLTYRESLRDIEVRLMAQKSVRFLTGRY